MVPSTDRNTVYNSIGIVTLRPITMMNPSITSKKRSRNESCESGTGEKKRHGNNNRGNNYTGSIRSAAWRQGIPTHGTRRRRCEGRRRLVVSSMNTAFNREIVAALVIFALLGICSAYCSQRNNMLRWLPQRMVLPKNRCFVLHQNTQKSDPKQRRMFALLSTDTDTEIDLTKNSHSSVNGRASSDVVDDEYDTSSADSFWVNGNANNRSGFPSFLNENEVNNDDVPHPTEKGGYSHTKASRAKISAANKGKTPWNKGIERSEDVKARIAAGVRANNRERFLEKLRGLNVTEEEYEEQKRKERREKDAEKRTRLTENGGYRPTEETRRKISEILKQKHAAGEIKPRSVDPDKVRRGFTHSEETRRKISESLRKRWATDPEYRSKMVELSNKVNASDSVRQKIRESLQQKWREKDFREVMLSKIAGRKRVDTDYQHDAAHREKISAAMKAKWQDEEYRNKTQASIAKRKAERGATTSTRAVNSAVKAAPKKKAVVKPPAAAAADARAISKGSTAAQQRSLAPTVVGQGDSAYRVVKPRTEPHAKVNKPGARKQKSVRPAVFAVPAPNSATLINGIVNLDDDNGDDLAAADVDIRTLQDHGDDTDNDNADHDDAAFNKPLLCKKKPSLNGSVDLLKEERRDLYDLLYGDEDALSLANDRPTQRLKSNGKNSLSVFASLEDENLDTFDPYGLDDF